VTGWLPRSLPTHRVWLAAVVARDRAPDGSGGPSELVVRLVGASHGHGRSTFPHATARLLGAGHELAGGSAVLHDQGTWDAIVDATHQVHGVWGCAYLEAILRAADGQVSGEADERA
jgi:CRISPR-associated endonuclease/helicase Cas3